MKSFVAISSDMTVATSAHDSLVHGPGSLTQELTVPIFWPPGEATGVNKMTTNVFHRGLPLAMARHDCGPAIPHWHTIPDPSSDVPATIGSSRKVMFSGSKVRAQQSELAACGLSNLVPVPMLACAEPGPIPTGDATTVANNTATFGMTMKDIVAGHVAINWEHTVGSIAHFVGKQFPMEAWAIKAIGKIMQEEAQGEYKSSTTDGEADLVHDVDMPKTRGLVKGRIGRRRDENGDWKWVQGVRVGPFGVEISRDGIQLYEPESRIESIGTDEVVTRRKNGDIVRRKIDFFDPAEHGRTTVEKGDEG